MMHPFLAFVVLFVFLGSPAQSRDIDNEQSYGDCYVMTTVDDFTDKKSHFMVCSANDDTYIAVASSPVSGLYINLSSGRPFHLSDFIPVMIRVDKGRLIRRSARWLTSGSAAIRDPRLAQQLLHDLASGRKVAIQVGDERGHIRLNGSRRAIEDFRRRAGLNHQQTLTLPESRR